MRNEYTVFTIFGTVDLRSPIFSFDDQSRKKLCDTWNWPDQAKYIRKEEQRYLEENARVIFHSNSFSISGIFWTL